MQYIKDETEFRVGFELQQMEERLLAAQLRNNMNPRQSGDLLKEKEKTPPKDKTVFEEDGDEFSQSYSVGDNLKEETEAINEAQEEVMDINNAADLEAKKCIKEKAMKAAEEENIRKRLRSQGDMNMMDKAKDLASKKNLDKDNDLPIVLNSSVSSLCDLAARMKINIGHDI
jgi:nanoRNase/pAp phosphatase (c-di-AMP/oligoRNAs hydrolase)